MEPLIAAAQQKRTEQADEAKELIQLKTLIASQDATQKAVIESIKHLINFLNATVLDVKQINNPVIPTTIRTPDVSLVVKAIKQLERTQSTSADFKPLLEGLKALSKDIRAIPAAPDPLDKIEITNLEEVKLAIMDLKTAFEKQKAPIVNVAAPNVSVPDTDMTPFETGLDSIRQAIDNIPPPQQPIVNVDMFAVMEGLQEVKDAINSIRFPVPNFMLPYKDSTGKDTQLTLDATGALPTSTGTYDVKIDNTTTTGVIYIGKAPIGSSGASAVWQIKKLDTNTIALDKTWAAAGAFTNIWNNRTGLTYT